MKDKTSYRIKEFLTENGPATPAEVAKGIASDRGKVKLTLNRMSKRENSGVVRMGDGRYSAVSQTVSSEVIELNKEKTKTKPYSITSNDTGHDTGGPSLVEERRSALGEEGLFSITKDVTVVSRLADGPSHGEEELSVEEQYLRQFEYTDEPDATCTVVPPVDGPTPEQELELQAEFKRWKQKLEAFKVAHPEALVPKENRPKSRMIFASDPALQFKTAGWSAPALDHDSGPASEFRLR